MDFNEIKNRAKGFLADLAESRDDRGDRDDRPADETDDPAARTDRLDVPAGATDDPAARTDRLDLPVDQPDRHGPVGSEREPDGGLPPAGSGAASSAEVTDRPRPTEAASEAVWAEPETTSAGPGPAVEPPADPQRLVSADRSQSYSVRWRDVQGEFVDAPKQAVGRADALVGELLDELAQLFHQQRRDLEHGLDRDDLSTEELRVALHRYRSFFDRLLSV